MADQTQTQEATRSRYTALAGYRIGSLPLPLFLFVSLTVWLLSRRLAVTSEISLMIAVLVAGASFCAWLGGIIPWIRGLGGPALACAFLPSYLVYRGWLPDQLVSSVSNFTKSSNFIYLFIAAVIVGSILGLNRKILVGGMLRIFVPLLAGSLAAFLAGSVAGVLSGLKLTDVLLLILVPVMAGGVGEGAIPLSVGYAELHRGTPGALLGQILPVVLFANFVAIVTAGLLNSLGKSYPSWTGEGRLQPPSNTLNEDEAMSQGPASTTEQIAIALLLAISLYLVGVLLHSGLRLPAPVTMLMLAVFLKLSNLLPHSMERAAVQVSRFFASSVTHPLLVAVAIALTPWASVRSVFHPAKLVVIIVAVMTLTASGFFVGRWMRLYPIEAALVNACHSGLGGTGDVAILTAAERMELLPFAQIATRIGGAITVALTLLLLRLGGHQ